MSATTPRSQRGAVLLLALMAAALIVSVLGTVIWRQSSLIQIETSERQRQQAQWLLLGAMDWGRLILREDARTSTSDHLSEPWAVPLQDSRLSGFLGAPAKALEMSAPLDEEVVLSGSIQDAQSRFNLSNLLQGKQIDVVAQAQLARLLGLLGLPTRLSEDLAEKMAQARQTGGAWLSPRTLEDLIAWGWDRTQIERLQAHAVVLPERTRVNVNTASPEVLSATVEGLNLSTAQRLVQARARSPWTQEAQAQADFGGKYDPHRHAISSQYFLLSSRLRLGRTELSQAALVKREGSLVVYRWVTPYATPYEPAARP